MDAHILDSRTCKLRVYYVSDVHLELRKKIPRDILEKVTGGDDAHSLSRSVIVLAGDIGNPFQPIYRAFLDKCAKMFWHVFVIAGNHEFYAHGSQKTMSEISVRLHKVCDAAGCHYLDADPKTTVILDVPCEVLNSVLSVNTKPVRFAGCTLWTASNSRAEMLMNDYSNIFVGEDGGKKMRVDGGDKSIWMRENVSKLTHLYVNYGLHQPHRAFLVDVLSDNSTPTVIVTHHAPSFKMLRNDKRHYESSDESSDETGNKQAATKIKLARVIAPSLMDTLYATDLEFMFVPPVVAWISGHTHGSCKETINDIPCVSNCYGYPVELAATTGFSYSRVDIML